MEGNEYIRMMMPQDDAGRVGTMKESSWSCRSVHSTRAFSLVEVMIALAIFFMAVFAILALMSTVLKNARLLQSKKGVDAGLVAAQLCLTNKLTEEVESGDFGDMYQD